MRIRDIAKLSGVSTATVSHVINNTRYVSDEVKQKVREVIERNGYTPNAHARTLAMQRNHTFGLILSDLSNPFFPELVKSIQECAKQKGYEITLANTNYDAERTVASVQRLLEQRVSGVAVMTSEMDAALAERMAAREIAVVFLDVGQVGPYVSNIAVNYEKGIRAGVEYLLELGHRRIAYISSLLRLKSAQRRHLAFTKTMKKYESEPFIYEGDFKATGGQQAVTTMLQQKQRPTAIVAANDLMAMGAMRELRKAGWRVPEDISVVGFDNILFAELTDPPLTTVALPRGEIGQAAVKALLHTTTNENKQGREYKITPRLIVRESTGPVRSAQKLKRKPKS
ncbi:MAG TPA: LacI family DNA-binding transcriptional regulator [Blastocatellia bacterium]|nr:LacI family DNA-binding transcriptional regulator [Blastocatellia bacterium]